MDIGSLLYFGALAVWSWMIAYAILGFLPKREAVQVSVPPAASAFPSHVPAPQALPQEPQPDYQLTEGFKAFQSGAELTVEDIVKGLSRRG